MKMDLHTMTVAAGLLCLAALAWLLWEDGRPCEDIAPPVDTGPPPVAPTLPKPLSRVKTYDGGRTTIPPLISDAALARRRLSKWH